MPGVKITGPVLKVRIVAVHGDIRILCSRRIVQSVGIAVTSKERQTVGSPLGQRYLQTGIVGTVIVPQLVDVRQIGKLFEVRAGHLLRSNAGSTRISCRNLSRSEARSKSGFIDVQEPGLIPSVRTNIADIQREAIG